MWVSFWVTPRWVGRAIALRGRCWAGLWAWRWAAVACGFGGVLLVVQPGLSGFNAWAWLCLGGTVLHALRDEGHTLIVVEHNLDIVAAADHVFDLGPGAGPEGGSIVYSGDVRGLLACAESHTARYLAATFTPARDASTAAAAASGAPEAGAGPKATAGRSRAAGKRP